MAKLSSSILGGVLLNAFRKIPDSWLLNFLYEFEISIGFEFTFPEE
jgi:hypothetical protein